MDTRVIAALLLIGRLITVIFILIVLINQIKLLRNNIFPELKPVRKRLFAMNVVLLLGQFIPITIDALGIWGRGSFNLLLAYVFSNNITAMIASIVTWDTYNLAAKISTRGDDERGS